MSAPYVDVDETMLKELEEKGIDPKKLQASLKVVMPDTSAKSTSSDNPAKDTLKRYLPEDTPDDYVETMLDKMDKAGNDISMKDMMIMEMIKDSQEDRKDRREDRRRQRERELREEKENSELKKELAELREMITEVISKKRRVIDEDEELSPAAQKQIDEMKKNVEEMQKVAKQAESILKEKELAEKDEKERAKLREMMEPFKESQAAMKDILQTLVDMQKHPKKDTLDELVDAGDKLKKIRDSMGWGVGKPMSTNLEQAQSHAVDDAVNKVSEMGNEAIKGIRDLREDVHTLVQKGVVSQVVARSNPAATSTAPPDQRENMFDQYKQKRKMLATPEGK